MIEWSYEPGNARPTQGAKVEYLTMKLPVLDYWDKDDLIGEYSIVGTALLAEDAATSLFFGYRPIYNEGEVFDVTIKVDNWVARFGKRPTEPDVTNYVLAQVAEARRTITALVNR